MTARYGSILVRVSMLCAACGGGGGAPARADAPLPPAADQQTSADRAQDATPSGDGVRGRDREPAVVFLGTSLTAGYGVDPTQAFPARIQALIDASGLQFHVVNAGVSGETSTGARQRIDWVLESIQGPLALLVLETGANDGLRGQDPDALRDNLDAIIARVRARPDPPRILLVGMEALPNLGADYARRFRGIYPEVARRLRVRLLPFLLEGVGGVDSLNQGDGIHPNPVGHQRVAEHLWTVLHPLLDSLSASG